jgi:hypothetical protein
VTSASASVDAQRLGVIRSERGLQYLTGAYLKAHRKRGTALGTDHPLLVLHKRAEQKANTQACSKLSLSLEQSDYYAEAHKLSAANKWSEAAEKLREAKSLRHKAEQVEAEYEKRAAQHLLAMQRTLSAVALLEAISDTDTHAVEVAECALVVDTQHSDDAPSAPSAEGLELAAHLSANAPGFSCSTYTADPYSPDETEGVY